MDFRYLHVRCGPYRILLPGENIGGIDPATDAPSAHRSFHRIRRDGWLPMIDSRRLLGLTTDEAGPQVHIFWRQPDGPVCAILAVDGVEGLRGGFEAEFLPLPRAPLGFQRMFDRLVYDGSGGFLLRLRPNFKPELGDVPARRQFLRALTGAIASPFQQGATA